MEKQEIELKRVGVIDIRQADIERLKEVPIVLDKIYRSVLQKGTDYGQIPGTQKPSLWKPGAELLAGWLKITPDSRVLKQEEDYAKPYFSYTVETRLYDQNGLYIGNGFGSSNSREPQYAFRWVYEREIPHGLDKGKLPARSDGRYRIDASPNELFGMANAILKKAKKRAFVDAILTVTGASRIFTQDIGEETEEEMGEGDAPREREEGSRKHDVSGPDLQRSRPSQSNRLDMPAIAPTANIQPSASPTSGTLRTPVESGKADSRKAPLSFEGKLLQDKLDKLPWEEFRYGPKGWWIRSNKCPMELLDGIAKSPESRVVLGGFEYKYSKDTDNFIHKYPLTEA